MQTRKFILVILFLLAALVTISCNKGSMPNLSTIKIATVDYTESGGGAYHYNITYDMYNNVDSISIVGSGTHAGYTDYKTFNYVGSSFVINDQLNGSLNIDANTNGQILQVLLVDTITMTYNGSELTELKYAQPSEIYMYQWDNNGDITGFNVNGGVVDTYYYDLSRNGQAGDALRIDNFLKYGRSYITTTHLPDEVAHNGNWLEEDLYKFDSQGRISMLTRVYNVSSSSNDTETYAYTYY